MRKLLALLTVALLCFQTGADAQVFRRGGYPGWKSGISLASTATPVTTCIEVKGPGATVWTVPATYISLISAEGNGESGAAAAGLTATYGGGGGGAGAYAEITTITASPGDVMLVTVGSGGTSTPTTIKDPTGATTFLSADYGRSATTSTGGAAGTAGASTGSVKHSGGAGGGGRVNGGSDGGGGGGGAATAAADGTAGGTTATSTSGAGGANGDAVAGGTASGIGVAGKNGANGTNYADGLSGSGSGASGGGSAAIGGNGGLYGGGPGGGGSSAGGGGKAAGLVAGGYLEIKYNCYVSPPPGPTTYSIVVVQGQSNAAGRGAATFTDTAFVAQYANYSGSGGISGYGTSPGYTPGTQYQTILAYPATNPAVQYTQSPEGFPPGSNWFNASHPLADAYHGTTGNYVLLVPTGYGGTGLDVTTAGFDCGVGNWSGVGLTNCRKASIDTTNLAITAAKSQFNVNSNVVGFTWQQGEEDGQDGIALATYQTDETALIAADRAGVTGGADAWFVIGSMVPEAITFSTHNTGGQNYWDINTAQMRQPYLSPNTMFVQGPLGDSNGDHLHYNPTGSAILGSSMNSALAVLQPAIPIEKPYTLYDWEWDDPTLPMARPIGTTDASGGTSQPAPAMVASGGPTGCTAHCLTTGTTFGANAAMALVLEAAPPVATDQIVTWINGYTTADGISGQVLRMQTGTSTVGGQYYGHIGVLFEVDSLHSTTRIYQLTSTTKVNITTAFTLAPSSGRLFYASIINSGGTLLATYKYSDNGGSTYTTMFSNVDVTTNVVGAGQIEYIQEPGSTAAHTFVDNIKWRPAD